MICPSCNVMIWVPASGDLGIMGHHHDRTIILMSKITQQRCHLLASLRIKRRCRFACKKDQRFASERA